MTARNSAAALHVSFPHSMRQMDHEAQPGAMSYLLANMEAMTSTTEETRNHRCVTIQGACEGRPVRRVVHCDGIRGVLRQHDGSWSLENEREVRILAALGGSDRVVDRFRALAAILNAGLIDRAGLTYLNTRLRAISDAENVSRVWIPDRLLPAVAFACTFMADSNGSQWLAWAFSARLDGNLSRRSLPGPGLCTMTRYDRLSNWGYDREVRWLDAMPAAFWDRLNARHDCCPSVESTDVCLSNTDVPCLRTVAVASDPRTTPAVLKALARSSDNVVLDLVASHPRIQAHVLLGLVQDYATHFLVQLRVPQNRSVSPWLLRRMAKNSLWQVRGLAAMNAAMPVSVLRELRSDEMQFVRSVVAGHENTPEDDLRVLARDSAYQVRRGVAFNPSCPVDLVKSLLADARKEVRSAAVSNPVTPLEAVVSLERDRAMAVRATVASRSDAPSDVLRALAIDDKVKVRRAAAWNHSTPGDALELLAAAPEPHVRYAVGCNPSTPLSVLRSVATDPDDWVRSSAAMNVSAPVGLLKAMSSETGFCVDQALAGNESTPPDLLASLARDDRHWIRGIVAQNASTPAEALKALATDDDADVRVGTARNPVTPAQLLETMSGDEDWRVRTEAAENLTQRRRTQLGADSQEKGRQES